MTNTAIPGHLVARLRPVGPTGLTTSQLRALLSSDSTFDEVVDQLVEAVEPGQLVALIRTRILRAHQALVRQRDEINDALTWLQVSIKAGDPITPSRNGRTGAGLTQSDLRSLERIATAARIKLADQDVDGEEIAAAALRGLQRRLRNPDDLNLLFTTSEDFLRDQVDNHTPGVCANCQCTAAVRCRRDCSWSDRDQTLCAWCEDEQNRCPDGCTRNWPPSDSDSNLWTCSECLRNVCVGCGVGPVLQNCFFCDREIHRQEFEAAGETW